MKLLAGYDPIIAQWVGERLKHVGSGEAFGPCQAIGVTDDLGTEILAGAVYHGFHPEYRSIEMSFAASNPAWCQRGIVTALMSYPFGQLRCRRVTAVVAEKNRRALRLNQALGFRREGCVRRGFGNQNAIIMGMLAKEWNESKFNTLKKEYA